MGQRVVSTSIPIQFEKIKTYDVDDTRFQLVKIWLMHLNENLNSSYFSKESVENAIPTLANTPILGYIETNKDGDEDFSDHRSELVKENGKFKFKYACSAYGVIPETNNARFEKKICDDEVEREFLVVDGLLWTKLEDAVDILNRDGTKAQSMEIHNDFTGSFNKRDKLFHFDSFSFYGAVFLGEDYNPAMHSASIEVYNQETKFEDVETDINKKVEAFKFFQANNPECFELNNINSEGGENMEDTKNKGQVVVESPVVEPVVEPVIDPVVTPTIFTPVVPKTQVETTKRNFGLTNSQLSSELRTALNPNPRCDEWGWAIYDFWYVDSTDSIVVAYEDCSWELVGFSYSMSGDFPVIDFTSKKRYKVDYIPMDAGESITFATLYTKEKVKYMTDVAGKQAEKIFSNVQEEVDSLKTQVDTLSTENTELKEFKTNKLATERKAAEDELFSQFSEQLSDEEIAKVRDKASELSLEDLEIQLFALVGKKTAKFSTNKKQPTGLRVTLDNSSDVVTKSGEKEYAYLIEEVVGVKNK